MLTDAGEICRGRQHQLKSQRAVCVRREEVIVLLAHQYHSPICVFCILIFSAQGTFFTGTLERARLGAVQRDRNQVIFYRIQVAEDVVQLPEMWAYSPDFGTGEGNKEGQAGPEKNEEDAGRKKTINH